MENKMNTRLIEWEKRLLSSIENNLKAISKEMENCKNNIFFDIGANVGLITENMNKIYKNWEYYTFEPVKEYYDYCSFKFKDCKNIKNFNLGFSDFNGTEIISKDFDNLGWNTIAKLQNYGIKEIVNLRTLDSFIEDNNIENIGFIKIDVEQYESFVIKGGYNYFLNTKKLPKMYMEVGGKDSHPLWKENCEMFEFLFDVGYSRIDYNNNYKTNDLLLVPKYK